MAKQDTRKLRFSSSRQSNIPSRTLDVLAVEDECHECVEIELPVLGAHMQRNGVHMAQLLDALHDISQLAQTVLAFVGRALRSGGEDAEREDVDEMQSVDHAAIERLHLARDDLSGRFERVLGHADDAGEIVGRACGDDAQFERQPPFAHPVDDVIDRAVAAGGDDHPDVGMRVERVASEVDLFGREFPPVFGEDVHDAPDVAGDAAASCGGIVEKERFLHG